MPDPIRVLRAITWLPVGGIERKLVDVLPRLDRERFDVSLVCLRERGPLADALEAAGIRVDVVPFRSRWDPRALRALAGLMRERRIDLVHSHMYRSNVPATVAARIAGVPHVWCQVHNVGTWESRRQVAVDRFLCRWREGMLAVSEQVRRDVIGRLRLASDRVRVIYNGVDVKRFRPCRESELRARLGAGPGDVVVVFAARLVEQKRPQDFVALARRAAEVPGLSHVRFWIAGDGPLRDEVSALAEGLDRVRLLGARDDMPEVLGAADVFVMTSTREGFSNALLEAMASGLCTVATDVGGNAEAIRSGSDGVIVPPLRPEPLWQAVRPMLEDATRREVFARSARLRAESFSIEAMVGKLQDLYESSVRGA